MRLLTFQMLSSPYHRIIERILKDIVINMKLSPDTIEWEEVDKIFMIWFTSTYVNKFFNNKDVDLFWMMLQYVAFLHS